MFVSRPLNRGGIASAISGRAGIIHSCPSERHIAALVPMPLRRPSKTGSPGWSLPGRIDITSPSCGTRASGLVSTRHFPSMSASTPFATTRGSRCNGDAHGSSQVSGSPSGISLRIPWEKALIYDNGVYKCQDHTWCDVLEFERLWDQAHAMPWEDRFSILRSAAVLYRGAFLNGISNHYWRDEITNKLRNRMGWLKWQLAGLYFYDGQFQEAMTLLEESLDINPYFSNGMEDLMRVLNHMEEHAQAVHTFNLWAERVKRDLDTEPSDRMGQLKIRIGDAVSDVTRPFAPGALQRAGVRGPRSLPRLHSLSDSPPATVARTWADLQANIATSPTA